MKKYKIWFFLILCNLFWAGNYVFGKYVTAEMTPVWITFSRWIVACIILFPTAYYIEKPEWKELRASWRSLMVMGILGIIVYNISVYAALYYTSSTNAALVNSLTPGTIVLFSVILLGEKISKIQSAGVLVSLMGVLVVLTEGNLVQILQMEYNQGDLIMLGAVVAWTLYSIIGRRLSNIPPITATAVSALFGVLLLLPVAIAQGVDITNVSTMTIVGILYIGVFASVVSFILWNMSIREIGASKAGIFINLIPVFTALISWLLGEQVTGAQMAGGVLVFSGVYLTTGMLEQKIASKKQEKMETPA